MSGDLNFYLGDRAPAIAELGLDKNRLARGKRLVALTPAQAHRAVAKTLNERGIKTAAGKSWTPVQVTCVRGRLGLTAI
jgi:hypothetical protein